LVNASLHSEKLFLVKFLDVSNFGTLIFVVSSAP
jgi:hypothetical protein